METVPNEILNSELQTQMSGYNKDEVDSLVKLLAHKLLGSKQKELEETIKNSTINARKKADALLAKAREEAAKLQEEAKSKADELLRRKQEEHDALEIKIKQLEEFRKSFVDNLQGLISSHLIQLDSAPLPADSSTEESIEKSNSVEDMFQEMLDNSSESPEEDTVDSEILFSVFPRPCDINKEKDDDNKRGFYSDKVKLL